MNALVESGCGRFRNGIGCDIIRHAPRPQLAVDGHRAVEKGGFLCRFDWAS